MNFRIIFTCLVPFVSAPLLGYSDGSKTHNPDENEWVVVSPLAVSTSAIESANGVHCYIGVAYEANRARKAAVAMTRHCLNLVAIAALVRAEIADGDNEEIKIAIKTKPTEYFDLFDHIFINGIDYDLSN